MASPNSTRSIPGFTETAALVLQRTTELALKAKSSDVKTLHMLFVLLVGIDHEFDSENFGDISKNPTRLWSAIIDTNHDPAILANVVRSKVLASQLTAPKPIEVPTIEKQPLASSTRVEDAPKRPKNRLFNRHRPEPSSSSQVPGPSTLPPTPPANPNPIRRPESPKALPPSSELAEAIIRAQKLQEEEGDKLTEPHHLILSLSQDTHIKDLFESNQIPIDDVVSAVRARKATKIIHADDRNFPSLEKFATDMTALAREGKLNEIFGREEEIRRVIQILCRKTKNSAVLLGEPGVGKTAIVEGLAHRIAAGQVPDTLKGVVYSLDLGSLFAGAGKGVYEERVKGVIDDVTRSQQGPNPVILFIDELHLITAGKSQGGSNSGMDAANLLKPALARGQFRCVGATTLAEYRENIEKDGALERRFATVIVNEPSVEEATTILRGIRPSYETHHGVLIMDRAIVTAVNLAHRYLTARRLPDSAVDLIDEACASARSSQNMQPQDLDIVEQDITYLEAQIQALKRDDHPDDLKALRVAEETLRRRKAQKPRVEAWWKEVTKQHGLIKEKRAEYLKARAGNSVDDTRITRMESELSSLRSKLTELEADERRKAVADINTFGRQRYATVMLSPDIVTPESVGAVVERATKIPVQRLLDSDKVRLRNLEEALTRQVVGQPEAVQAVTHAIQLSRTGLSNTNRPIASFMFTGPSGTGKTLLSKALAQELFGQETAMIRIDGSEYSESHSVSRLVGSPPGYVGYDQGGQLTEYVRRTPYCIVLLDEIEKTCREFHTLFLQVLDEGRLTDGQGRLVNFRNTVIIMTSNVGADILSKVDQRTVPDDVRAKVMNRFKERFPVEFLNRIDEIVMFHTMSELMMWQILDKHLKELQHREGIKKLNLQLNDEAKQWLIKMGISREYGARPLARVIQKELLNPLSLRLLEESIGDGDSVRVFVKPDRKGLEVLPANR